MLRFVLPALGLLMLTGCPGLVPPTQNSTVRLVNNGEFAVEATVYYSADSASTLDELPQAGERVDFTLAPDEEMSFTRPCTQLQAVAVTEAELILINEAGPTAESDVRRSGFDYECEDTIVFAFDHSAVVVDFDVVSTIESVD